jgi:hypothetical protein
MRRSGSSTPRGLVAVVAAGVAASALVVGPVPQAEAAQTWSLPQ